MLPSMTAQGWRKRQIIDRADTVDHAQERMKVLEAENADLKALLSDAEYFVTHYGVANTLTNQEQQVRAAFLTRIKRTKAGQACLLERIHTYTADPLKNPSTGL